ncbi:MAG: hypothetical protein LHW64_12025 [Candidatus Cloacimonetes bacterium]|nr:hypothetical protein [Candidatus Cloacimonadota bacterium]MDY0230810.1 hypothetical protein [Candidatus Cloacimonadaceae bacterium]
MSWYKWDGRGRIRQFLLPDDCIYTSRIYTSGQLHHERNSTNNYVSNFKMGPNQENPRRLYFRDEAINIFVRELKEIISINATTAISWIPTSKNKLDVNYDNRFEIVLKKLLTFRKNLTQIEIFTAKSTREPFHHGAVRDPQILKQEWEWCDCDLTIHERLIVIDDVLTEGTNFRAFSDLVLAKFPNIKIYGVIWALAEYPEDFEDFFPIQD